MRVDEARALAEPIPKDVLREYMDQAEGFLSLFSKHGTSKDDMAAAIEANLSELQRLVLKNVEHFSGEDMHEWTICMALVHALLKVSLGNPMYDTDALPLQVQSELLNVFGRAHGVVLKK